MKFTVGIFTALLLLAHAQAKVLIYKGTHKSVIAAPPQSLYPLLLNIYLVVDPDTQEYSEVLYWTKDGKHQGTNSSSPVNIVSEVDSAGHIRTALCKGSASDADPTHFSDSLIALTGTNSTFQFTTTGITQTTNFPKTLAGAKIIIFSSGGTRSIQRVEYLVRLQAKATIDANTAGKTIAAATSDLAVALQKLGYLP
ncbi:MAG: hypothetical protein WCF18_08290 [Chthoniobacteraceae bacterium]